MKLKPFLIVGLLVTAWARVGLADEQCYVDWSCGGSSQCAALMGGSSGRSGPFDSSAACHNWINQYNHNASCSCSSTAASGASAGGGVSLPSIPSGGGLSSQQQMGLMVGTVGAVMLQQGIQQAIYGDPQAEARQRAEQAAKAAEDQRIAEEKQRVFEDSKQRLLNSQKNTDAPMSGLAMKNVDPGVQPGLGGKGFGDVAWDEDGAKNSGSSTSP